MDGVSWQQAGVLHYLAHKIRILIGETSGGRRGTDTLQNFLDVDKHLFGVVECNFIRWYCKVGMGMLEETIAAASMNSRGRSEEDNRWTSNGDVACIAGASHSSGRLHSNFGSQVWSCCSHGLRI